MKKITFLTILFFQLFFAFAQESKWGPWNYSDCYPKIQYRAKLVSKQYYSGGSTSSDGCNSGTGYQFKVQLKNNYSKTVWVNFSGGNKLCVEKNQRDGIGLNLSPGEIGEASLKDWYSNSTEFIYVLVKSMAFLSSKDDDSYKNDPTLQYERCDNGGLCQVCRINIEANHCPEIKTSTKVKKNDVSNSNEAAKKNISPSVADLENIILDNLKKNLKLGSFFFKSYEITFDRITPDRRALNYFDQDNPKPNTLYIKYHTYSPPSSYLFKRKFSELRVDKIVSEGKFLIHLDDDDDLVPSTSDFVPARFIYDPGVNEENYKELLNAIDALKNPNKNFSGTSNEGGNLQKIQGNNTVNNGANLGDASNLISALDKKEFAPIKMKEYYKEYFKTLGYTLISDGESSNGIKDDMEIRYLDFSIKLNHTYLGGGKYDNYGNEKKKVTNFVDIECSTKAKLEEIKNKMKQFEKFQYIVNEEKNIFIIRYSTHSDGFH